MVPIRQNLVSPAKYGIKCPYIRTPTRIVVHNTGNDAPAKNEVSYMISNDKEISFHYAVDDLEIVQGIPEDRNVWGSGDGQGPGNMQGIHIEICYSASGGTRFIQAEKNAAEYIASLLKKYGWGMDKVTKHQDYNGKYCPHRTLDMGWGRFLKMVQAELDKLNKPKEEIDMTKEEVKRMIQEEAKKIARAEFAAMEAERAKKTVSKWAEPAVDAAKNLGLMSGDAAGNFRPQSNVTRQELAQVAVNIVKAAGKE